MTPYASKGRCWNCNTQVTGERYCHGCHEFVCAKCDATQASGPHKKEAHLGPVKP